MPIDEITCEYQFLTSFDILSPFKWDIFFYIDYWNAKFIVINRVCAWQKCVIRAYPFRYIIVGYHNRVLVTSLFCKGSHQKLMLCTILYLHSSFPYHGTLEAWSYYKKKYATVVTFLLIKSSHRYYYNRTLKSIPYDLLKNNSDCSDIFLKLDLHLDNRVPWYTFDWSPRPMKYQKGDSFWNAWITRMNTIPCI